MRSSGNIVASGVRGKPPLNGERCRRNSAAFYGNRPAVPQNLIGSDETHSPTEVQQRDMADDCRCERILSAQSKGHQKQPAFVGGKGDHKSCSNGSDVVAKP